MAVIPSSHPWTLTARWIFPVDGPPLEQGTVTIRDDRILAVEPYGVRTADVDLGNAAVIPGLVNAHTHLDLTGLRGRVPPGPDFTAWLRAVIRHRRGQTPEQVQADVRVGLAESMQSGTTLLGDIASGGASWDVLAEAPLRAVVFLELLGLPWERARQAVLTAHDWLEARPATPTCRPGLSPHAPYSVGFDVFASAANLCRPHAALAVHLGESAAEVELLRHRRGPFVPFLQELGVWDPDRLVPNLREAVRLCARAPHLLLIHANHFAAPSVIPRRGTVVYCPRTHAAFGHPPHPFRAFLARGVRVALGTDSLASNPDLSVLAEARFVHERHPDVPGEVILRLATLAGAEALGWQQETGSLTAGKSADLVAVPLPDEDKDDPYELLLRSAGPAREVLWRGRWVAGPRAGEPGNGEPRPENRE
jgi:cytosine/adenosine deaminase-related metal-dependent hydrolase